jgi:hypothetical protein
MFSGIGGVKFEQVPDSGVVRRVSSDPRTEVITVARLQALCSVVIDDICYSSEGGRQLQGGRKALLFDFLTALLALHVASDDVREEASSIRSQYIRSKLGF